jgi:hypothetical protein
MPGEQDRTAVQVIAELYAAIRDRRIADVLALVDEKIICMPLVRPGLSMYQGHDGMARLVRDLHAVYGDYCVKIDEITEQGMTVTVQARIFPEPGLGPPPLPVISVYTLRDGLVTTIESQLPPA